MPDYKSMYYALAAQVANAIDLLVKAEQDGEESAIKEDCMMESAPQPDQHEDK
ncbi:MAG: hypothetical protein LUG13_00265 [Oscillospiraceae bacterium]|nr:hypothetical protein [Oscillospiraceae bacterium]